MDQNVRKGKTSLRKILIRNGKKNDHTLNLRSTQKVD